MSSLPPLFFDTGGWIRLMDARASPWVDAIARGQTGFGKAHTSDYVLLETYSFILKNHRRDEALRFLDIATGSEFILHACDADLVDRAMARARERAFKRELSLVDWTSALLMEDHGIRHVLTTDRGFAQLGFDVVA